jgi:hypothetical protein
MRTPGQAIAEHAGKGSFDCYAQEVKFKIKSRSPRSKSRQADEAVRSTRARETKTGWLSPYDDLKISRKTGACRTFDIESKRFAA